MAVRWNTAAKGVRYREHPDRLHGRRADRYWCLQYKRNGKVVNEAVGWWSDGITQAYCEELIASLRKNWTTGTGPQTLAEMRQESEGIRQKAQKEKQAVLDSTYTFDQFWAEAYLPYASSVKKESTIASERYIYSTWLAPAIGKLHLADLTVKKVEEIVLHAQQKQKSAATIRYVLAVISQIWTKALTRDLVSGDCPTKRVKKPRQDNRRMRFLT